MLQVKDFVFVPFSAHRSPTVYCSNRAPFVAADERRSGDKIEMRREAATPRGREHVCKGVVDMPSAGTAEEVDLASGRRTMPFPTELTSGVLSKGTRLN